MYAVVVDLVVANVVVVDLDVDLLVLNVVVVVYAVVVDLLSVVFLFVLNPLLL